MLIKVEGDLLLSGARAIAHVVAPNDDFHSGLALALRERWPSLYKDFRHYCRLEHPKAGTLWAWKGAGTAVIFNLMAQEAAYGQGAHPGKATLQDLGKSLAALREACEAEKIQTVAMSRLATGVGGLDWKDVEPLIEQHFGDGSIRAYVYAKYRASVKAAED